MGLRPALYQKIAKKLIFCHSLQALFYAKKIPNCYLANLETTPLSRDFREILTFFHLAARFPLAWLLTTHFLADWLPIIGAKCTQLPILPQLLLIQHGEVLNTMGAKQAGVISNWGLLSTQENA